MIALAIDVLVSSIKYLLLFAESSIKVEALLLSFVLLIILMFLLRTFCAGITLFILKDSAPANSEVQRFSLNATNIGNF